jgi:heat shock protein HslJ/membrane-bound inhibitor of C-type lysozyme
MPRSLAVLSFSIAVSALVACAGPGGTDGSATPAGSIVADFQCGAERVTAAFREEALRLTLGAETIDMRQTRSGSGARYEAVGDPRTWFWNKGRGATLVVRGKEYPECSPADQGPKTFRARGNEPSWAFDLEPDRMTLLTNFGAKRVVTPRPAPHHTAAFTRYAARTGSAELSVTIFDRVCRDSMSGMPHPNAVEVVLDGTRLAGCGGEPAALLQGAEWVVEDIDRKGIVDRSRATLNFGPDGRVFGRSSCNTYTGVYKLTGEGLAVSQTAGTMMACPPALLQQEARFLEVLRNVRRFDVSANGALVLQTDDRRTITARR